MSTDSSASERARLREKDTELELEMPRASGPSPRRACPKIMIGKLMQAVNCKIEELPE